MKLNTNSYSATKLKISFLIMILITAIIAGFGLYNISIIKNNLAQVTANTQEKLKLTASMRKHARERTLNLHVMTMTPDPFVRDNYWMEFNKNGSDFADSRQKLIALLSSEEEKKLLELQGNITREVIPLQLAIADLSNADRNEEASKLLIEKAFPLQNSVFETLDQFYHLYVYRQQWETQNAHKEYDRIVAISLIAGLMALAISILTASWITRRINQYQTQLQDLNNNLEIVVDSRTNELQRSETRQRTIVENAIEGIIALNSNEEIVKVNPAAEKLFKYSEGALKSCNVNKIIYMNKNGSHLKLAENLKPVRISDYIGQEIELNGLRRDGTVFPVLVGICKNATDEEFYYSCFIRDLTEQKRVDRLKNEFVSIVSHELRTPITSIQGALGLLIGGALGKLPIEMESLVKLANNNSHRLLAIVNDLLDIQKIESGEFVFRFQSTNILPVLKKAINENMPFANKNKVNLVLKNEFSSIVSKIDNVRILQVLNNLISNAIKFSPINETVTLETEVHNDHVRIWISDHGCGMSDEFQQILFDKFTQEQSAMTRKQGGAGLGLSIVKMILENHNSRLYVNSSVNIGTSVYFDLPATNVAVNRETGTI